MTHLAAEPSQASVARAAPPPRRAKWSSRAFVWLPAGAGFLITAALALTLIPVGAGTFGVGAVSVALLAIFSFAGTVLAMRRQRGEILRERRERETAEGRARDTDTRRVEAEALLRECERQLRWLSEGLKDYAVVTLDLEGRILTWDKAAETVYGYAARDAVGRPFSFLCPDEDVASGRAGREIKRALVTGGYEERGWRVRQGGWKFWAEIVFTPMREEGGRLRGLLCLTRDISAHRQAEDALRSSRLLYRNLTETAQDVVITFERDGGITSLNLAFDRTTGWSRGDWVGQSVQALAHPDDLGRLRELLQCLASGETPAVVELRLRLASGQYLPAEWMTTPQLQDGQVLGGLALVRDLTDRKKAEESLRVTEEKLRQAQKMEAVGRLAGGIAHDFNNLLTVILGNAEMFQMTCQDAQLQMYASEIAKAGERAATLTQQLLAFSRKTVMQPRVIDVNARIENVEHMLHRLIGADVALATRLHAEPLPVMADPGQIEQVIMNLVVNARDAMPDGGALTIATGAARLDAETHLPAAGDAGRPYALLEVTDTGVGMDDHVKSHLFEPFFTTKEQGKGTGLGLAMVYGIVKQTEGHIEVVTAPGCGTTFKIYLPLTDDDCPPVERADKRTHRQPRGTETILLAEDEAGVRALASTALRLNGYNVLECADGAKALALCESFEGPIHLLITDVVMPCLGGVDLARHMSRASPHTKVLFMSGYPDRDFVYGPGATACYLQKPFSPQDLTARVRQLLDSPVEEAVEV